MIVKTTEMAQFSKQKLDVETAVHIAVQALNL